MIEITATKFADIFCFYLMTTGEKRKWNVDTFYSVVGKVPFALELNWNRFGNNVNGENRVNLSGATHVNVFDTACLIAVGIGTTPTQRNRLCCIVAALNIVDFVSLQQKFYIGCRCAATATYQYSLVSVLIYVLAQTIYYKMLQPYQRYTLCPPFIVVIA